MLIIFILRRICFLSKIFACIKFHFWYSFNVSRRRHICNYELTNNISLRISMQVDDSSAHQISSTHFQWFINYHHKTESFTWAPSYFTFYRNITLIDVVYFSKICHRTSFQGPRFCGVSEAPCSEVFASAMLILLTTANWNVWGCTGVQSYNMQTTLRENPPIGSKVETGG
jgi:hypothetical protein